MLDPELRDIGATADNSRTHLHVQKKTVVEIAKGQARRLRRCVLMPNAQNSCLEARQSTTVRLDFLARTRGAHGSASGASDSSPAATSSQ